MRLLQDILRGQDIGLPDDAFSNPVKEGVLRSRILDWCTEVRSDMKKTVWFYCLLQMAALTGNSDSLKNIRSRHRPT